MWFYIPLKGVAVAAAFCRLESSPVSHGTDEFGLITLQGISVTIFTYVYIYMPSALLYYIP